MTDLTLSTENKAIFVVEVNLLLNIFNSLLLTFGLQRPFIFYWFADADLY